MRIEPEYVSRIAFLRECCHGKHVLHVGCSSGRYLRERIQRGDMLHGLLCEVAEVVYGVDIDEESLLDMSRLGYTNLSYGDAERLEELALDKTFDVVIAGDLLEHLTKPGALLDGVKRFLGNQGQFIVSTNNAFGLHYQIRRWLGRYQEHYQHVCFFSPETLTNMFERHGYQVESIHGAYTVPPYTRCQKVLFVLGQPLFRKFPILAGTLIVTARHSNMTLST